ncbi:ScbA/BarX family gamma-butyrolactone biosynthesis protein [Streptomyces boninensis]|uniref:ScbA/BarX family gamma-butyrolactone biosynthesis protein n=1 Tax=Streptomyces boninensis TaxID=2039455 RepID=UPI003B2107FB
MLSSAERALQVPLSGLTTTVPREYVHRAAVAEVFLTSWHQTGPDAFTVTAQWPRSHSFYGARRATYDPLMLCETIRQAPALLMHAAYRIPSGYQMIWTHFRLTVNPRGLRVERSPAELRMHVTCSEMRRIRDLPAVVTMDFEVMRGAELLAVASTRFSCHSPAVYRRMRGERGDTAKVFAAAPAPAPPVPPSTVGRLVSEDVVLSHPTAAGPGQWQLRLDTSHPVLFDHSVDHVPGMVLLEAIRQVVHVLHPGDDMCMLTGMDVAFHRYVEFDSPCAVTAEPAQPGCVDPQGRIRIQGVQGEAIAFTATAEVSSALPEAPVEEPAVCASTAPVPDRTA